MSAAFGKSHSGFFFIAVTLRNRPGASAERRGVGMNDSKGRASVCGGGDAPASICAGPCGTSAALAERAEGARCRSPLHAAVSQMTSAADVPVPQSKKNSTSVLAQRRTVTFSLAC